jgi:hypothetical protein
MDLSTLSVAQIAAIGIVIIAVIAALTIALSIIVSRVKRWRVKLHGAEVSSAPPCDCSMREIIQADHRMMIGIAEGIDAIIMILTEQKINGEVTIARNLIAKARSRYMADMAEIATEAQGEGA